MCNCATVGRIEFAPSPARLAVLDLRQAESRLSAISTKRRRDKLTEPIVNRIATDLRYVFRRESERVVDLLKHRALPYTPARESIESEALARLLLNGVDVGQYQAVLEDAYRSTMPGAMDATIQVVLNGTKYKYRVNDLGEIFLAGGVKLVRFAGAEQWIRDRAIVFSRRYAPLVSETTNKAIRNQLAQGMAEFEGTDKLIARVQDVYSDASRRRAEMIARTETSRAYNAASLEECRQIGVGGKYWIISGSPYSYTDVCSDNADMNTIPLNASFLDIDDLPIDGPPAHINCLCSVGYDVGDDWEPPDSIQEEP